MPEISEEVGEEPEVTVAAPSTEVGADVAPSSPTSAALLDALVEAPSAEDRRKRKGKEISSEGALDSGDDVAEVPPGLMP